MYLEVRQRAFENQCVGVQIRGKAPLPKDYKKRKQNISIKEQKLPRVGGDTSERAGLSQQQLPAYQETVEDIKTVRTL